MSFKWNTEEEILLRTLRPTNSYTEIAVQFEKMYGGEISGFTTLRSAEAIRKKCERDSITPENSSTSEPLAEIEDRWNKILSISKEYESRTVQTRAGLTDSQEVKILCLSDMHFPFCRVKDLKDALDIHADADIVVLNGDLFDGEIFSSFGSTKRIAALKEYEQVLSLVTYCSDKFPKVAITSGNHDIRPAAALRRADFPTEATQIFRPDLLARVANGEVLDIYGRTTEIQKMDNVYYQSFDTWYVRIGNTIFAHPTKFSGAYSGATVEKLRKYFEDRYGANTFDSIVCAHTHRQLSCISSGKLLIEQGAMCTRLPYEHRVDMKFAHSTAGYCIIYQDKFGNTNFNQSHLVYLGSQLPPKKGIL